MLAKMNIELQGGSLHPNMASLFHGYLMKEIEPSFAEYLHYNQTNPFTSCIVREKSGDKAHWRITTFNKMAYDMIIAPLAGRSSDSIYIEHKDMEFQIKNMKVEKSSFEELYLNTKRTPRLRLLTPTSFKSDGRTHIFPDVKVLLNGVINKINLHSDSIRIEDEHALEELMKGMYLRDYNLRTAVFSMEKIKVKGFIGTLDVGLYGDPALLELLNFILASAEYTGLGIKTSLGMGGVNIEYRN